MEKTNQPTTHTNKKQQSNKKNPSTYLEEHCFIVVFHGLQDTLSLTTLFSLVLFSGDIQVLFLCIIYVESKI